MRQPALSSAESLPIAWGWRSFFALVRVLWWAFCLSLGGFLLLWLGLYFYLAPHIGQYKSQMEQVASRKLGLPVRMDSVQASDALLPQLSIRGLRVYDQQGRVALALPLVQATISPQSLLRLGAERVVLVAPDLLLRRDAAGRIFVGGLDWGLGEKGDEEAAADWFFSLASFEVQNGSVLWVDEKRRAPPLALSQVQIGIHNRFGRHDFFVAASPPADWGQRFAVQAHLKGDWPSQHAGAWRTWKGQIYADFPLVDAAHLGAYLDGQMQVQSGAGAVRSWAEFDRGRVASLAVDAALARVSLRLQQDLPPLDLQDLQGRLLLVNKPGALSLALKDAAFTTADGQRWPLGMLQLDATGSAEQLQAGQAKSGQLRAEKLALPVLASLAQSLPMAAHFRQQLQSLAPQGDIAALQFSWTGDISAPSQYRAVGQVQGLALAAQAANAVEINPDLIAAQADLTEENAKNTLKKAVEAPMSVPVPVPVPTPAIGQPGLAGASVAFDVNQAGGKAQLAIAQGWLEFPGVFQEPRIPLAHLKADINWQRQGQGDKASLSVQVAQAEFANDDMQGSASAKWHTLGGEGDARFPGVLDLKGQFERAQASRVWRYLPLEIPQEARDYVQQAVQGGVGSRGSFQVTGDLRDIPSKSDKKNIFRIAAHIDKGYYSYVPKAFLPAGGRPWPALSNVQGDLLFDGYGMFIKNARGLVGDMPAENIEASLPDWDDLRVAVRGRLQGDLGQALASLRDTEVNTLLADSLNQAQGKGQTQIDLALDLPIDHLEQSKVSGKVLFIDDELQLSPLAPKFEKLQGQLRFDEGGFVLDKLQGLTLGGALQVQGGMGALAGRKDAGVHIQAQGQISAAGVRAQSELPWLAQLGQHLQGATPYSLQLDLTGSSTDFALTSSLQGLAINLPAPLGKTAAAVQNLRVAQRSLPAKQGRSVQSLKANWGQDLAAQYEIQRSSQDPAAAPVVRGLLSWGSLPANTRLPDSGVQFLLQADQLDADAWRDRLGAALDSSSKLASEQTWLQAYVPQRVALRVGQLGLGQRTFHGVNALVERGSDQSWKISGQSQEAAGQLQYRSGTGGQADSVWARLKHLDLGSEKAGSAASTTTTPANTAKPDAPLALPDMDVQVDDFHMAGKALGRLEIQAANQGAAADAQREWQLKKLGISSPEAQFSGTGTWLAGQGAGGRTVLNFNWALQDAGKLLDRLGQTGVLAKGQGSVAGQVSWQGGISAPDYPSMNGKLQVQVADGRFLKADPGAAKLLGVLNLQALPRRLNFDFRDVFAQGFAFDFVRGDVQIQKGLASTNNLQIKGVSAAVLMEGVADIKDETQDVRVLIVPEINAGTAALVATAINPAIGLGAFVAQWLLSKPVNKAATQELRITGSWADPKVEKVEKVEKKGK
jgi:uncharacterized protein (TIGR02099 family)